MGNSHPKIHKPQRILAIEHGKFSVEIMVLREIQILLKETIVTVDLPATGNRFKLSYD